MSAENYQDWLERVEGTKTLPVATSEVVKSSAAAPFQPIGFISVSHGNYRAEIGAKGKDLIFHFFWQNEKQGFPANFEDAIGDAFLTVFPFEDKLSAAYTVLPELQSWAVRVAGYGSNPNNQRLALQVLEALDERLK